MKKRKVYQLLDEKMFVAPSWVPRGDRFIEILETLFTPEEAELALVIPFMPASLTDISIARGMESDKVEKMLKSMSAKGLVYEFNIEGNPMYLLFGQDTVFNYPIKYKQSDVDQNKLRSLWKEYFDEGLEHTSDTVMALGRVLPVEETISHQNVTLPYDIVSEHIDKAKYLSVGICSCRSIMGNCDNPLETCIGVGYAAKYLVEQGLSRSIDKEEAKKIVKEAHEAGLVSISTNMKHNIGIICHCCSCCCFQIGLVVKHEQYEYRPVGSFEAFVDPETCDACELCVDRCPMVAFTIDDVAFSNSEKCIGCGLCIDTCPVGAISLKLRVPSPAIPEDLMDYTMQSVKGQGTTDEFMKELKIKKSDKNN